MSSSTIAQITQDIYEIQLPHHSGRKIIKQFSSIRNLEKFISNETGFTDKITAMNIPFYFNTLKIGRLWRRKSYARDNDKSYRMCLIFDDDCIETIYTHTNDYRIPECDYSIYKVKADINLIITDVNDNYHFDYLPSVMVQDGDRLHNHLWHKYLKDILTF